MTARQAVKASMAGKNFLLMLSRRCRIRVTSIYSSPTDSVNYLVVKFVLDGCISSIPAKRILHPPPQAISIGDKCTVKWTDGNYGAVVLARGMLIVTCTFVCK